MPFLTARDGRVTLQVGNNVLGGRGKDAVELDALASLPATAVLIVRPDALSVIRRLAPGALIRVDGHTVGESAQLRHGTRIDIGNHQLTYGHPAPLRAGPGVDPSTAGTEMLPSLSQEKTEYRLVESKTGVVVEVPATGGVIGREPGCDIVVAGQGVSRRHATIRPSGGRYLLTDQSSNGTRVNGERLTDAHALRPGDLIMIGVTEFRWEPKEKAPPRPLPRAGDATELVSSVSSRQARPAENAPAQVAAKGQAEPLAAPTVLATLSNRSLWRREFKIERPVASIGRGDQNDVQIVHESISAAHATLVRKGDAWFVLDLGSSNGTFVNGLRVAGERELPAGSTLTLGTVKLTFQPRASGAAEGGTQHVARGEFLRRLTSLWEKGSSRKGN